jgi:hypothetical protein
MSKNNVHPAHYKVDGRDRQDDAAAPRQARAMAAKASSRERPDRMSKGPYFQRPEPAPGVGSRGRPEPPPTPPAARRATSKEASVTRSKKEPSTPRPRRKPNALSTQTTGRPAKRNAAAATRDPTKKR